jgi:ankyrin repeat protein
VRFAQLVNALKEKRQSADFHNEYTGLTPLHLAARKGLTTIVMLLVSAHASIEYLRFSANVVATTYNSLCLIRNTFYSVLQRRACTTTYISHQRISYYVR